MAKNVNKKLIKVTALLLSAGICYADVQPISPGNIVTAAFLNNFVTSTNTLNNTIIPSIGNTDIPTGYGSSITTAISYIVNGNSSFTNTGLSAAADHIYYVSPSNLSSSDLCGFINTLNTKLTTGDAVTVVLAPANGTSYTYSCSGNATLSSNVTLIGTGTTQIQSTKWNLGQYHLTLNNNDQIKGIAISATDTNTKAANTAALQITQGSNVTLTDDVITEGSSSNADAISVIDGANNNTGLTINNSTISLANSSSTSYPINYYNHAGTIDINHSQVQSSSSNSNGFFAGGASGTISVNFTAENNSTVGNVSDDSTVAFMLIASSSTLGTVPTSVVSGSKLISTGISAPLLSIPINAACVSSFDTGIYTKLTNCN